MARILQISLCVVIFLLDGCSAAAAPMSATASNIGSAQATRCDPSTSRGRHSCQTRCDRGDGLSCLLAGRELHRTGHSEQAAAYLEFACYDRVASACALLSELHTRSRDFVHAAYFHRQACQHGYRGQCSEEQTFVTGPHDALQFDVIGTALHVDDMCWQGSARGCFSSALMHAVGAGVRRDPLRAQRFYARACALGDVYSCGLLDTGVQTLTARATEDVLSDGPLETLALAQVFETACHRQEAAGCFALGRLYANGDTVPQDGAAAESLFVSACRLGDGAACEELRRRLETPQPLNLPLPLATLASAH